MNNPITHAIRKQTAIDDLARMDAELASLPKGYFYSAGRRLGKTTTTMKWMWSNYNKRAYLESVINEGWDG